MLTNPKISIITVVRNGEKHIEDTIKSVLSQSYNNVEYIIIDGNSTDGTTSIIKKYQANVAYWISESDKGIYDAMNKGVAASTGDWLLFINSDDFLATDTVICQMTPYLTASTSLVVYGNILYINPNGSETLIGREWAEIRDNFRQEGMLIPHQATFHSRNLFLNNEFNIDFIIAGDYDFLLRYLNLHDALFVPIVVAKMRFGGISYNISPFTILRESRKAQLLNGRKNDWTKMSWVINTARFLAYYYIVLIFGNELIGKLKKMASWVTHR